MKLTLASISSVRAKSSHADALADEYTARAARYLPVAAQTYPSEAAFLATLDRSTTRTPAHVILLDSSGKPLSSDNFAACLSRQQDNGTQSVILAIGPADGWSAAARTRADLLLSFGPITLPHTLARAVLAEQVYRALTILAGHPYHSGH